ncbi:MAG: DUF4173 domain-containing protein [Oscillospiraceae bacterium]|nr:DUF4173 domain-containing protein [Oscillospiraceae bacterium]
MDNINQNIPWQSGEVRPGYVEVVPKPAFPTGKGELIFGVLTLAFSLLLCNSLLFAGADLGFGVGLIGTMLCACGYLRGRGYRPDRYAGALLGLCLVIAGSFVRSSDGGLKFWMVCVLLAVPSLALCLTAGKNRRCPDGFLSLLDSPRTLFGLGFGRLGQSARGIREAFGAAGALGKKGGAVVLGLLIAVPLLAVMIPLLMFADAAFEGLVELLPDFQGDEILTTALLGIPLGWVLYTRTTALHHVPREEKAPKARKGLNHLTVNTVLTAVALLYVVYLISQLAYFLGGFSGILPEGYTRAQYARRGFFEMAWLCAINLSVIALSVGLVSARGRAPRSTRIICLFLGLVTLFLVAAASAKMFLYIGANGLTRLRVLTEVFMLWLALTTVFVCVWLFRPKLPYMKPVLLTGLALCAGLMWADVDTQVARYNVRAYQEGRLETVDLRHLAGLNAGAVPYIEELTRDSDPEIAQTARDILENYDLPDRDLRGWNYTWARARDILEEYRLKEAAEAQREGST